MLDLSKLLTLRVAELFPQLVQRVGDVIILINSLDETGLLNLNLIELLIDVFFLLDIARSARTAYHDDRGALVRDIVPTPRARGTRRAWRSTPVRALGVVCLLRARPGT